MLIIQDKRRCKKIDRPLWVKLYKCWKGGGKNWYECSQKSQAYKINNAICK